MKNVLRISVISLQLLWLSSCAVDPAARENVYKGIYDATNQLHKYDNPSGVAEELPVGDQETVPYERYQEERRRELKKDKVKL